MANADMIRKMEGICFGCMQRLEAPGAVCSCGFDNRNRSNGPGFLRSNLLANRYFAGKMIGRGGFGITYIGYDLVNDRKVAIKEYFPVEMASRDRKTGEIYVQDPNMEYMFQSGKEKALREVEMLSGLSHLKNVVNVFEAVKENGSVYMIMEYIDGRALNENVQKKGAMAPRTAYRYICAVTEAVAEIQEKYNLSHSDISPDNIMLRSDGQSWTPVLVDFGAAQKVQDNINTVEAKVAKQYFSAPELLTNFGKVNKSTDCFSLCATFYYLLAGGISKNTMERYIEELPTLKSKGVDIGPNLEAVITKGMSLKRENRYPDAGALLEALKAAAKKDGKIKKEWDLAFSGKKSKPKLKVFPLAAAALAVVIALILLLVPSGGKKTVAPDLRMEQNATGVVFSWDTPGAQSYDVRLASSGSSRPIRYSQTKAKNVCLPASDVYSGQHFELEVTVHYEDGSDATVFEAFDIG